jgi:hypothetical protein
MDADSARARNACIAKTRYALAPDRGAKSYNDDPVRMPFRAPGTPSLEGAS